MRRSLLAAVLSVTGLVLPGSATTVSADGREQQVRKETTAGILEVTVQLLPDGGEPVDAILRINCDLPGARFSIEEGIELEVGTLQFTQDGGGTLFHRLR